MKRLVSLIVAIVLLFSLVGCGKKETQPSAAPKDTPSSSASAEETTKAKETEATEEPVRIVYYQNNGSGNDPGSEAGSTKEAYEMVQNYILEETGVFVDAIKAPPEGGGEKLSMLLASGEPLDMWFGSWQEYAPMDMIRPLNELLEEAPAVQNEWSPWQAWPSVTDKDGNVWAVPRMTPTTPHPIFIREDWLDAISMEQPTTMEELNSYLYAVKDADLFEGGQTVPLITRLQSLSTLEYSFVGGYVEHGYGPFQDDEGNIKPLQLAPGYTDFLAQINQWYADGILHMENTTWDVGSIRDQLGKGSVGAAATWYSDVTMTSEALRTNTEDGKFVIYEPGLTGPNGGLIQTRTKGSVSGLVISSRCENPEAAMRVINWSYEDWENYQTGLWGIKDVHWKYQKDTDPNDHIVETIPNAGYWADFCISIGLPMETKGVSYDEDGERNMHNLWVCEHLDDFDATTKSFDFGVFFNNNELEENVPTSGDIRRVMDEELIKFITGERPIEDYDNFIQELYDVGLEDWITEYTRQYKELT